MSEQFNIDLPPPFKFRKGTQEERDKQLEEYIAKLTIALDEMFKRLFNRLLP
jgi:5'-deoxynucleotidase YfbR-like HD superfamily hydrolase